MRTFVGIVRNLSDGAIWIAGAGLIAMAILTFSSAMSRWIFSRAIIFSFEVTEFIFVGVALLSLAFALRTGAHIKIPLIFDHFPRKVKPWVQFATNVILLLFAAILLIGSVMLVVDSYQLHSKSFLLGILRWIPQMVMPVGFTLLSLEALVKVLKIEQDS